jgi:PadR family transcriptional regulator AphA
LSDKPLPKLTTTSFALLGLLQRQPWSAYELTRFMRNSVLRAVWPRAESHLYSEPKLLLKRGFVDSHQEQNGARKRTVYTITDAGREALQEWLLEQRQSEFHFEYELLVRLAFAENLDLDHVRGYLGQVIQEALKDGEQALLAVKEQLGKTDYLAGYVAGPYSGALISLIAEQIESRILWAESMLEQLQAFDGTQPLQTSSGVDIYRQVQQRLEGLLARHDRG